MASFRKPAHAASRGLSLGIVLGGFLSVGIAAGCGWALASSFSAMHEASRTMADNGLSLATPKVPTAASTAEYRYERRGRVAKFLRFADTDEAAPVQDRLTVASIRTAHERRVATQLALAEEQRKAERAKIDAAIALARTRIEEQEKISGQPALVAAYAENTTTREIPPFGLVLANPENEEGELALPTQVPLPEARPLIERADIDKDQPDEKPVARQKKDGKDDTKALAYAKPEKSLFDNLFKRDKSDKAWPGHGTKVAIYDVSNATVYLPDGTKLRAHSGIGQMRDNPRYEHVKMRGPTPAGIYRLSMREKRFYGVEAIRMTSIDGRDPKNRTGLLTHTNLLRGQIGSHGCVAFQNYQPFLRAFKKGQIKMIVVVPELPSSKTQLAALYRKAGA